HHSVRRDSWLHRRQAAQGWVIVVVAQPGERCFLLVRQRRLWVGAKQGVALLAKPLAALGRIRARLSHTSIQRRNRPPVIEQRFFISHWAPSLAETRHHRVLLGTPTMDPINIHLNALTTLMTDHYSRGGEAHRREDDECLPTIGNHQDPLRCAGELAIEQIVKTIPGAAAFSVSGDHFKLGVTLPSDVAHPC